MVVEAGASVRLQRIIRWTGPVAGTGVALAKILFDHLTVNDPDKTYSGVIFGITDAHAALLAGSDWKTLLTCVTAGVILGFATKLTIEYNSLIYQLAITRNQLETAEKEISELKEEQYLRIANDPKTPPEKLEKLANSNTSIEVFRAIIQHPSVNAKTISRVTEVKGSTLWCEIARNQLCSAETIAKLIYLYLPKSIPAEIKPAKYENRMVSPGSEGTCSSSCQHPYFCYKEGGTDAVYEDVLVEPEVILSSAKHAKSDYEKGAGIINNHLLEKRSAILQELTKLNPGLADEIKPLIVFK